MKKKSKAIGGTFAIIYHGAMSEPIPYDASPEQIDKASRQLIAKIKRRVPASDESTPRATRGRSGV